MRHHVHPPCIARLVQWSHLLVCARRDSNCRKRAKPIPTFWELTIDKRDGIGPVSATHTNQTALNARWQCVYLHHTMRPAASSTILHRWYLGHVGVVSQIRSHKKTCFFQPTPTLRKRGYRQEKLNKLFTACGFCIMSLHTQP